MSWNLTYNFFALFVFSTAVIYLLSPARLRSTAFYFPLSLLASLGVLILPFDGVPVFYYMRGYIGELSITSSLFFGAYVVRKQFAGKPYQAAEVRFLLLTVLCLGLLLYPLSLGLGQFDPYRLGYHPYALLIVLFLFALCCWYKGYYFLLLVLTSVVAGFSLGLLESNNLWDYLLDAVLWLFCITRYLLAGIRALPKLLRH